MAGALVENGDQCRSGLLRIWSRLLLYRFLSVDVSVRMVAFVLVLILSGEMNGWTQSAARHSAAAKPQTVLDSAKLLAQKGDAQGALALLEQAKPEGKEQAEFHALKGLCDAMLGRPAEAGNEFDQAIALRPEYAPFHLSYGLALANFNDLKRASKELDSALRLDPSLPGVRFNDALVLARAGEFTESEKQVDLELLSKAARPESPLQLWLLKAHDAYSLKDWRGTIEAFQKVLTLNPDDSEAYSAIGDALYSLNRPEESMLALQKAIALHPQDVGARVLLGKLYQEAGKQEEAIAALEAADRLQPGDRDVTYRLFRIYRGKADTANASRMQKKLEALVANDISQSNREAEAARLNDAGITLEKQGLLTQALEDYDQAARSDVTNIIFARNAALLLCKMGRPEEAIPRLREILLLEPDDTETEQILAVAQESAAGVETRKVSLPAAQAPR